MLCGYCQSWRGGCGKGGYLKYQKDKPLFWPDKIAFSKFEHLSRESLKDIDIVMEALVRFHNLDPNTHHTEDQEGSVAQKKCGGKKKAKSILVQL